MKKPNPAKKLAAFKAMIRKIAHAQLDDHLNANIEDIAARMALGAGMSLTVHLKNPEGNGRAVEDPSLTEAAPLILVP